MCVCVYIYLYVYVCMHVYMERKWHPLQCSCLENPMDRRTWWAAVHGVEKTRTRLSTYAPEALKNISRTATENKGAMEGHVVGWAGQGHQAGCWRQCPQF